LLGIAPLGDIGPYLEQMSQSSQKQRSKVLLVAEHASAIFGGEALIPFQYFKCLREMDVDVHLLVHERTRKELYEAFPNDVERLHFVADSVVNIWSIKIGKLMPDRIAVFTVRALSHLETQIRQRRLARSLVNTHRFDIIHEPIPVAPKMPSVMFGLSVPVIIGPMNGGMDYPPNYKLDGNLERLLISILRWTATLWNKVLPGKPNAALLLVANKRSYNALPHVLKKKHVLEFAENGVDVDLFMPQSRAMEREGVHIVYVGRLVDVKRVDLLIAAAGKLIGEVEFKLHIAGDGPLRGSLEKQVQHLSLTNHVRFYGRIPQVAAADLLRKSDIMVLPSMRECGGAVVLEAMASGVPVIAANWGGPADYIVSNTGILIQPATPEIFVQELAKAVLWLAKNPQTRAELGRAARQRVQECYDWRVKAKALSKIYDDVLTVNAGKSQAAGK
jgi:glycosyltransferase involved in cell wall biosynthesis